MSPGYNCTYGNTEYAQNNRPLVLYMCFIIPLRGGFYLNKRAGIVISILIILIAIIVGCYQIRALFMFDKTSDDKIIEDFISNKALFTDAVNYVQQNTQIDSMLSNSPDIKDSSTIKIFTKLSYRGIHKVDNSFVYFVKSSEYGFNKGVIYSATDKEPESPYITVIKRIDNNWFYYSSK